MAIRDKQPDADVGRVLVDNDLESLEKRITVSYGKAAKDITTDLDAFLAKYETKDAKKREDVENGLLSEEDYIDWRKRQIFQSDAMRAKIDDLSQRMVNADKQAMAMVNNELPEIYATSYNFGGFRGEMYAQAAGFDYTQFTIINQDAVKTLMTEDPDLIPWKPQVDGRTDKAWNRKHIQNAVEQGIIKGEGMDKISRRLLPVVGMDKTAAIRTARTAVNGVENKGRTDATQRVVDAGIPMVQQWSCTHDNRTRFTHILIDGETISVGGYFSNGLRYPADPSGDPAEVYNCRCSAISVLEGIDHSKDDELYEQFMKDEYYDDWVKVKEDREAKEEAFQERKEKAEEWAGNKERTKEPQKADWEKIVDAPIGTKFNDYGGLTKQREYTDYHGTRASNRLNTRLRKGEDLSEDHKRQVRFMDSQMEEVKSPILAYRSINLDTMRDMGIDLPDLSGLYGHDLQKVVMDSINSRAGMTVVDKGYMSATYQDPNDIKGIWLKIDAQKGTPAYLTSNDDEREITFGRNCDIKILGSHFETRKNIWGRDEDGLVIDVTLSKKKKRR